MAIMWDPPPEQPSLEPTPAEIAWKRWLMQALITKNDDAPAPNAPTDTPADDVQLAA